MCATPIPLNGFQQTLTHDRPQWCVVAQEVKKILLELVTAGLWPFVVFVLVKYTT